MKAGLADKLKVVSEVATDCDQTKGFNAAKDILATHPDVVAIYSACGPPALGAIQAIKNAHVKPSAIILVGFDGLATEVKAVRAGTEDATVAQHPDKIGSLGVATLYAAVQGRTVARNVDTGTAIITPATAK